MVPPRVRSEYMYELRLIAENIVRERLENFDHVERYKAQETFRESSGNLGNAAASVVEQPQPLSPHAQMDSTTAGDSQAIPAFHILCPKLRAWKNCPVN